MAVKLIYYEDLAIVVFYHFLSFSFYCVSVGHVVFAYLSSSSKRRPRGICLFISARFGSELDLRCCGYTGVLKLRNCPAGALSVVKGQCLALRRHMEFGLNRNVGEVREDRSHRSTFVRRPDLVLVVLAFPNQSRIVCSLSRHRNHGRICHLKFSQFKVWFSILLVNCISAVTTQSIFFPLYL